MKNAALGRRIRLYKWKRLKGFEPSTFCMAKVIGSFGRLRLVEHLAL